MKHATLKTGLLAAGLALSSSALANSFTLVRPDMAQIEPGEPFEVQVRLRLGSDEYLTGYGLEVALPDTLKLNQISYPQWATSDTLQDIAASVNPGRYVSSGTVVLATLELEATQSGTHTLAITGDDLVNTGAFINNASHELTPVALSNTLQLEVKAQEPEQPEQPESDSSGGGSFGYWALALLLLASRRKRN